jgi:beta-lactamase regulating signal transducer with metallopeptidase domain
METLLSFYVTSLVLRSLCIAALAWILTRATDNVATRHAVWTIVLASMLLMPAIDMVLPAEFIPVPVRDVLVAQLPPPAPVAVDPSVDLSTVQRTTSIPIYTRGVMSWPRAAAIVHFLVAGILLFRFGLAYRRIRQLKHSSAAVTSPLLNAVVAKTGMRWRTPSIHESDLVRVPLTIGFFKPAIVLPIGWKDWDEFELRAVLWHELAHVRRCDWAIALIAGLNKCLFWFNPISWWLEKHLSALSEEASDEASLAATGDAPRYAEVLLQFAAAAQNGRLARIGIPMAKQRMHLRIHRILAMRRPGRGVVRFAGWVALFLLAAPIIYAASAIRVASDLSVPSLLVVPPPLPPPALDREQRATEAQLVIPAANLSVPAIQPPATAMLLASVERLGLLLMSEPAVTEPSAIQVLAPPEPNTQTDPGQRGRGGGPRGGGGRGGFTLLQQVEDVLKVSGMSSPFSIAVTVQNNAIVVSGPNVLRFPSRGAQAENPAAPGGDAGVPGARGARRGGPAPSVNPDLELKLNQTGTELELACKAQECSVTSILPGGSTSVQTFRAGDTGIVSASSSISVTVTK